MNRVVANSAIGARDAATSLLIFWGAKFRQIWAKFRQIWAKFGKSD